MQQQEQKQEQQINPFKVVFDAAYRTHAEDAEHIVLACKQILTQLSQELKAAKARIAELEGKNETGKSNQANPTETV